MPQNQNDIILDIKVKYEDAIKKIAELNAKIEENKKVRESLKKALQAGAISQEEYNKSIAAANAETNYNKEAIQALNKEIQNNLKIEREKEGSLNRLRAALSNANEKYAALSDEERKNSEEGKKLKKEIEDITKKLKDEEVGLEGYVKGVKQGIQTLIDGFGLLQSAVDLSDTENKKLADTIKNLQTVMESLASLESVLSAFKKESAMMTMLQDTATKAWSASTKIATAIMKALGISTTTTSTAFKVLRGAIIATGIGALLVLVGELIAHWDDLTGWFKKGTDGMSAFGKAFDKVKEVAMGVYEVIKTYILTPFRTLGKILSGDFKGALTEMAKGFDVVGNYQKGANEQMVKNAQNALKKIIDANNKALSKILLGETEKMSKTLEVDKARGMSAEDLYNRETEILDKKIAAYRLALNTISDHDSDAWKEMNKNLEDAMQQQAVAKAANDKRIADESKQRAKDAAQAAKERADKEREAIRQAEDAALAIVKEGIEKQRQTINQQYDRQIEDLKRRLEEEKNLTDTAREAINKTIIDIESKRQQDLDKLSDEEIKKRIENENKLIELQLQSVAKGGEEEYQLRLQQLEKQQEAELRNTELTEEMKAAIRTKYETQQSDLEKQRQVKTLADQKAAIELEWRQRLDGVMKGSIEESNLKLQQAQSEYDNLLNMDVESKAAMFGQGLEAEIAYTNAVLDQKEKVNQAELNNQQVIQDSAVKQIEIARTVSSAFSDMLSTFAEENEALAAFAKAVALFNIGLDIAKAIAAVPAMSAKGDPYTYAIRVATAIATVMASMAKAKQLLSKEKQPKAPKLATGGLVRGSGSGTSDSITANLSRGESVMTASATGMFGPVLSALNQIGGGVPINVVNQSQQQIGKDMLTEAFREALRDFPNPVVSVEEINNTNKRVQVQERLSYESI
ncbi:MAG: hypothetical protein FWF53_09135 [Candidatus Azobacteroides sp.]|nr:hypothetical protein [Candidatus Azobacteroides sp.]